MSQIFQHLNDFLADLYEWVSEQQSLGDDDVITKVTD